MISVTETAAEKINKSLSEQDMEGKALRLGVFVGGCSGGHKKAIEAQCVSHGFQWRKNASIEA